MDFYTIYNTTSGQITATIGLHPDEILDSVTGNVSTGQNYISGNGDPVTQYVIGGVLTTRPAFSGAWNKTTITANGIDTATYTGLPNPTVVTLTFPPGLETIFPGPFTETSGAFSLNTATTGYYAVLFSAFPFLDNTFTITAV